MTAKIIDGKAISGALKQDVKKEVAALQARTGVTPGLAVILVGENPASQVYVRNKKKSCGECDIRSFESALPADTEQSDLLAIIKDLNQNPEVHGILCQLPLPGHIDENAVLLAIDPAKDVDGFHPMNVGKFMTIKGWDDIIKMQLLLPCTPYGCIELLDRAGVNLKGANAVVVGRSNIVGKPVSMMLMAKNATVTICHSRTKDLPGIVRSADVVVAAIGQPEFVKGDWIKEGAAVIDVGINRMEKGLVGDVEYAAAAERASAITPVPGGVGPMTIAMLMKNTVMAATSQAQKK